MPSLPADILPRSWRPSSIVETQENNFGHRGRSKWAFTAVAFAVEFGTGCGGASVLPLAAGTETVSGCPSVIFFLGIKTTLLVRPLGLATGYRQHAGLDALKPPESPISHLNPFSTT